VTTPRFRYIISIIIQMATKPWVETDNWETPPNAFDRIFPFIPRSWVIWDPFYCLGLSAKYMRLHHFQVIHDQLDFFTREPPECDCIVTNPPYSKFKECLPLLLALEKPMFLFLSQQVEESVYWQRHVQNQRVSIMSVGSTICCYKNGKPASGSNRKLRWYCFNMRVSKNSRDGVLVRSRPTVLTGQRQSSEPCVKCGMSTKKFLRKRKCKNKACRFVAR